MKIGIFTLTHALNYGAFYQMFGMYSYLTSLGFDVTVYDCERKITSKIKRYCSISLKRGIRRFKLQTSYDKDRALIDIQQYKNNSIDLAILGSDEIWNLENRSFEHAKEYLGIDINSKRIIAYAPSIGFSPVKTLSGNEYFTSAINKIHSIFPRDSKTQLLIEKIRPMKCTQVVDPTILFSNWTNFINEDYANNGKYILYYGYTSEPPFKDQLISLARSKGLKIYSAGFNIHSWCDINHICSPLEFLNLLNGAAYVFTTTFHGLVMSVLLNQRICYSSNMQKIDDFAEKIQITNLKYDDGLDEDRLLEILHSDRRSRNKHLMTLRQESLNVLNNCIGKN